MNKTYIIIGVIALLLVGGLVMYNRPSQVQSIEDGDIINGTTYRVLSEYPNVSLIEGREYSYYGRKYTKYDEWIISAPEEFQSKLYPVGHPLANQLNTTITFEIHNVNNGNTWGVQTNLLLDKRQHQFNISLADADFLEMLLSSTPTWFSSTTYSYINRTIEQDNQTVIIPEKQFRSFTRVNNINSFRNNFPAGIRLDPTVSACGLISEPGVYNVDTALSSTTSCMNITAPNVDFSCDGNYIYFGDSTTATTRGIKVLNASTNNNLTIRNCNIIKVSSSGANHVGIEVENYGNVSIINNTILMNGTSGLNAINFVANVDNSLIENNSINSRGTTTNNVAISTTATVNNISIRNNQINTSLGASTSGGDGISILGSIFNIQNNNIFVGGTTDAHGVFINTNIDIGLIENNNILINNSLGASTGIRLNSGNDAISIINNSVIANNTPGNDGIYIVNSASGNFIDGNKLNSSGNSIWVDGTTYVQFRNQNITNNNFAYSRNIFYYGSTYAQVDSNLLCPNNTILNNPSGGHYTFVGCNNVTLTNWIRIGGQTDTTSFINTTNGTFYNNTIDNMRRGVRITIDSADVNVSNNNISTFGYDDSYGVSMSGRRILVDNNLIDAQGVADQNHAIYVTNADNSTIQRNTIRSNGTTNNLGIYVLVNSDRLNILSNTIRSNGTTTNNRGIVFDSADNSDFFNISHNIIETGGTNAISGIVIQGLNDFGFINNNTIITRQSGTTSIGIDLISLNGITIENNIINVSVGRGTTSNAGISFNQAHNNTVRNNTIQVNGTTNTNHAILIDTNAQNNTLSNNSIPFARGDAFRYLVINAKGNKFENNTLVNISQSDLFFTVAGGTNETYFINQKIRQYNMTGSAGSNLSLYHTTPWGNISFIGLVNGSDISLSNALVVGQGYAIINETSGNRGLNKSARITLANINLDDSSQLYRNGVLCPASVCQNLTSLNVAPVVFNVSIGGNYSISLASGANNTCSCPTPGNNWNVLCSDGCNITSNCNLAGNNITLTGPGYFNLRANISNIDRRNNINQCQVYRFDGGKFEWN